MAESEYGPLGRSGKRSGDPVWWDRGFLPHFESQDHIQHVCFHLVDSLPASAVQQMAEELKSVPPILRDAEREKRFHAYLDVGHGACWLRVHASPKWSRVLSSSSKVPATNCTNGV